MSAAMSLNEAAQREFRSLEEQVRHYARLRKEAMKPREIVQRAQPREIDVSARIYDPSSDAYNGHFAPAKPARVVRDYLWLGPRDIIMPQGAKARAKMIRRHVAETHGFSVEEIDGPRKEKSLVLARHDAIARVYVQCPELSLPEIGQIFGGRDHTTVIHAARKMGVYGRRGGAVE